MPCHRPEEVREFNFIQFSARQPHLSRKRTRSVRVFMKRTYSFVIPWSLLSARGGGVIVAAAESSFLPANRLKLLPPSKSLTQLCGPELGNFVMNATDESC